MKKNWLLVSTALLLPGCASILPGGFGLEERETHSKYAAGQVNVAIFDPIPWYTISEDLKPRFGKKNANDVIGEVAPVVGADSFTGSRRTSADFQLDFAGNIVNNSSTDSANSSTDTDGVITATSSSENSSTTTRQTPELVTLTPQQLQTAIDRAAAQQTSQTFDFDPDLKYRAATSLFQNIQLLDKYLNYGPGQEENAYLIRFQITINPYAHQRPYDVYTRLFFRLRSGELVNNTGARIFPLLIGENLERINTRRIAEEMQSIGSSLRGRSGLFSGGFGYRSELDRLRTLLGSDLNSLLTYSQLSDQSLLVRLGAPFNAKSGWAMRARTYDVTAVVVLQPDAEDNLIKWPNDIGDNEKEYFGLKIAKFQPKEGNNLRLEVMTDSSFRHARTGRLLDNIAKKDEKALSKRVSSIFGQNQLCNRYMKEVVRRVNELAARNKETSLDASGEIRHITVNKNARKGKGEIEIKYPIDACADEKVTDLILNTALYGESVFSNIAINAFIATDIDTYRRLREARAALGQQGVSTSLGHINAKDVKLDEESGKKSIQLAVARKNARPEVQTGIYNDDKTKSTVQLIGGQIENVNTMTAWLQHGSKANAPMLIPTNITYDGKIATWTFPSLSALGLRFKSGETSFYLSDNKGTRPSLTRSNCVNTNTPPYCFALRAFTKAAKPARNPSFKYTATQAGFETAKVGNYSYLHFIIDPLNKKKVRPSDVGLYRISVEGAALSDFRQAGGKGSIAVNPKTNAATFAMPGEAFELRVSDKDIPAGKKIKLTIVALAKDKKTVLETVIHEVTQP